MSPANQGDGVDGEHVDEVEQRRGMQPDIILVEAHLCSEGGMGAKEWSLFLPSAAVETGKGKVRNSSRGG